MSTSFFHSEFLCPYFPAFGLNTERYGLSLRIQSGGGKIWTRNIPNTDSFHAVFTPYEPVRLAMFLHASDKKSVKYIYL